MTNFTTLLRATGLAVTVAMPVAAQDADTVMATVNGTEITLGHMIALQERLPQQYKELDDAVLMEGLLEQLIQQTALSQEIEKTKTKAIELGLENEMRAFLAGELLARVGSAEVSEEDIAAAYSAQYTDGEADQEFNASHILVETEEQALEIIQELEDGADFAELAQEKSTGPSGPNGGNLGWFGKGQMVPAFEAAVIQLDDGAVSGPVETQFGFHIVKRLESRAKEAPSLDAVRSEIEQSLRAKAIEDAISGLTDSAEVTRAEVTIEPSAIRNLDLLSE